MTAKNFSPKIAGLFLLGMVSGSFALVHLAILPANLIRGIAPENPITPSHYIYPVPILAHLICGLLFMVIGPFQFMTRIRVKRAWLHRLLGRVFVICGVITGVNALFMNQYFPPSRRHGEIHQ